MARRIRPAKPMAVMSAVAGVVILTIGIVAFVAGDEDLPVGFLALWVALGVAIVGFNLWAAFGKGGHIYSVEDR
jgi:hypothetical protein